MRMGPLFCDARWAYYDKNARVRINKGAYLICDNGYLRWPTTICLFTWVDNASAEGYFTTHLEGIRKDIECTFGILKKRWRILNHGFFYREVATCEKIFAMGCWLNNFLLDLIERPNVHISHGGPVRDDGVWLSSLLLQEPAQESDNIDRILSEQFAQRCSQLVKHLQMFCKNGAIEGRLG